MISDTKPLTGWKLKEAIRRCADPDLWTELFEQRRAWKAQRNPSRFMSGNSYIGGPSSLKIVENVQRQLNSAKIVAWGRRETPLAELQSIPASAWHLLRLDDARRSIALELPNAQTRVFDIQVYPVLDAPDALDHLSEKTLVEAMRLFVLEDPQLVAVRKRSAVRGGSPAPFGWPLTGHGAVWPVQCGPGSAFDATIGREFRLDNSALTRAADDVLIRRFCRLIHYLSSGDLVAEGTPGPGSVAVRIPRSFWQRDKTYIDLENGDLLEHPQGDERDTYSVAFAAVMLKRPSESSERGFKRGVQQRETTNKAVARVVSTGAAKKACTAWLLGEMRKSPSVRPKPKSEYRKEAFKRWPEHLSGRGFDNCWSDAIAIAPAPHWAAAGAPSKSVRNNQRAD